MEMSIRCFLMSLEFDVEEAQDRYLVLDAKLIQSGLVEVQADAIVIMTLCLQRRRAYSSLRSR